MASPEHILGRIGVKLAHGAAPIAPAYRPPVLDELVRRIERALDTRG